MTKRFLIIFAALLVTAGLASANTLGPITTTTPISPMTTDWSESPDITSLAFAQFNSALGTLTKVKLELSGDMDTEISITNTGSSPSSGTVSTHLLVYVKHSELSLGEPQINTLSPPLVFTNLAVDATATGSFDDIELYALKNYTSSTILTAFTGTGSIVLDADTYTTTALEASGSFDSSQITDVSLTGTVTYEYTIPEPATITLLCAGAFALLKRKSSK